MNHRSPILEKFKNWVDTNPQKLLYAFLDLRGSETQRYSYESFLERTGVIAGCLRTVHNLETGDRLLLAYPPGLEMICAFFACARAGVIPVPVYPPSTSGFQASLYRMAHIAKDCGAAAILTTQEYDRALGSHMTANGNGHSPEAAFISSLKRIVSEDIQESSGPSDFASSEILFLQYTSGSTSSPKGVMVTHKNIVHNCTLVANHPSPVAVSWLPQYHDMGLIGYYLYSALAGGTTYGFSPTDFIQRPALWFEAIKKYRASATSAPNFAFEYCLQGRVSTDGNNVDLSSLRFLMTAAEPVRPDTYQRFLERFQPMGLMPESFYVAYGLAENTLAISSYGRKVLSVSKSAMALRKLRVTSDVSGIAGSKRIVSCGKPLGDVVVRIVDPEKNVSVEDSGVGEIWVSGKSKCLGYWNNPSLTQEVFHARIVGESQREEGYLRTGDLGFLHEGELYVCGRTKDMIIVRGQNYYPQDIEQVVESSSELVRKAGIVAFEINEGRTSALAVIAEARSAKRIPDPHAIVAAIRHSLNVSPAVVAVVAPKSIPKTSSGKVMRNLTRQMWMEKRFEVLEQLARADLQDQEGSEASQSAFQTLKTRYKLAGTEKYSLVEAGVDSLDLVIFMHEVQELLKERGAEALANEVDVRMIQEISVADLFRLADLFDRAPEAAVLEIRHSLLHLQEEHRKRENQMMSADRRLSFIPPAPDRSRAFGSGHGVLLTGGTGFVGPFFLRSLLEQTEDDIHVLVRASDESAARERLWSALASTGDPSPFRSSFDSRVKIVCGDLAEPGLGLPDTRWKSLSREIRTIYHNGAAVNYLLNYEKMRATNVTGTNEVVRLAFDGSPKTLNYVSTTFVFGWAVKEVLYETDSNDNMELLDFGYSQSKWIAEQVIFDAARHGLTTRVFRPALVSPSVTGGGNNLDIAIRLLAFMINHGIGVEALNQVSFVPADVVANNIVAISNSPGTSNSVFHVTRDHYASMVDITDIIARLTGRQFDLFKLPEFVPEVVRRCTKEDLLFPLLDFLIGSVDSIASMEFKRYDSSTYQRARDASKYGQPDPSLEDTVSGILRFMSRKGIIALGTSFLHSDSYRRLAAAQ